MCTLGLKNKFFGLMATVALATTVCLTPAFAQQIILDGKTNTSTATNGNVTFVTTGTVKNNIGFNSFKRFNVDSGKVINLELPFGANNLINYVNNEATIINGKLNSIKYDGTPGGNIFLVNPYGVTINSSGVINVGSLVVSTPTTPFMAATFISPGSPNDITTNMILTGTAPINTAATIVNSGVINAIDMVKLDTGSITNSGTIYTDAQFQVNDLSTGDVINLNTLEYIPDLVIENGAVEFIAVSHINHHGLIYSKDITFTTTVGDIAIDSYAVISAGNDIVISSGNNLTIDSQATLTARGNIILTACGDIDIAHDARLSAEGEVIITPHTCGRIVLSELFVSQEQLFVRDYVNLNIIGADSLSEAVTGLAGKSVHIQVGTFEMDIAGSDFHQWGKSWYYTLLSKETGKIHVALCPHSGRIRLSAAWIHLEGTTNPITARVCFSDGYHFGYTAEWRDRPALGGRKYTM